MAKEPEGFWDSVADGYERDEDKFDPIHVKTIENTEWYLRSQVRRMRIPRCS